MKEYKIDPNEAFQNAVEIIAQKEREITLLKIQLISALTRLEEVENGGDTVQAGDVQQRAGAEGEAGPVSE